MFCVCGVFNRNEKQCDFWGVENVSGTAGGNEKQSAVDVQENAPETVRGKALAHENDDITEGVDQVRESDSPRRLVPAVW